MKIVVTGGASFIGSHLVEELVKLKHEVIVVDDFSSGTRENLQNADDIVVLERDLHWYDQAVESIDGADLVYHLAAVHGGREFIHFHELECADNFAINHNVLKASRECNVDKIIFTSSACVYPETYQREIGYRPLKEDDVDFHGRLQADKLYGWSKLMCELELQAMHRLYGYKSATARFFTAYGPREDNTHALIALTERALRREDPYVIWGTGKQGRDWIYVDDLVRGLIKLQRVNDGSAYNFGSGKMVTIDDAVEVIFEMTEFYPSEVKHDLSKPTGPHSRVGDISKAWRELGWTPKTELHEGLKNTIEYLRIKT